MEEFVEFATKSKSNVWGHFLRNVKSNKAKCKHCDKLLVCSGGSTSTLRNHLLKQHKITPEGIGTNVTSVASSSKDTAEPSTSKGDIEPAEAEPTPKKRKITDFFQSESEQSMEMTVTRMVTLDGLTFRVFVNSVDLVRLFKRSGYTLPKSANTIRSIVLKECEKAKLKVTEELAEFKNKGHKFSLTADEWSSTSSSTRNRRYINVNLHSPHFDTSKQNINLGLVRIMGSATAAKCGAIIEERLKSFNVNFDDVVGLTTDGASVMVKMGKGLPLYHQLCYAHALQLAVLDVLYNRNEVVEDTETQLDDFDLDVESESDSEDDGVVIIPPRARYASLQNNNYKHLISKMRQIVKMFRKSPTRNDEYLQKHVIEDFGKDISLIIDCKTRWSSLCNMMERFIMLYPSIEKALIDLKSKIRFKEDEIQLLKHVYEVLEIVRSVVEILCQENATLLTADTALKHMFSKLENMSGPSHLSLSAKLLAALKKRIGDRYILIQGVLKYLHSPQEFFGEPQSHIFQKPTPDFIKAIVMALSTETVNLTPTTDQTTPNVIDVLAPTVDSPPKLSFKSFNDELQYKLAAPTPSSKSAGPLTSASDEEDCLPQMILLEIALHENGGQRGKFLSKAYQHLLSVKPTSVEAERAFSTAGYFCSKLRSRLSDSTLDAVMFLRAYITSQKEKFLLTDPKSRTVFDR